MNINPKSTLLLVGSIACSLPACAADANDGATGASITNVETQATELPTETPQSEMSNGSTTGTVAQETGSPESGETGSTESITPPPETGSPGANECTITCNNCGEPLPPGVVVACALPTAEQLCVAQNAVCERQQDGSCSFTETPESEACTMKETPETPETPGSNECAITCNNCGEPPPPGGAVACALPTAEQLCIAQNAVCERQQDGSCSFTETPESEACTTAEPPPAPSSDECTVICTGCTEPLPPGVAVDCIPPTDEQICVAKNATCELQPTGDCGFTETPASATCAAAN